MASLFNYKMAAVQVTKLNHIQALGWSLQLHSGCVATYCTSSSSGLVLTTSLRLCCHLLYLIKLWVGPYNFTQVVLPPTVPHQALGWSLQLHSGCVATYCTSSSSGLVLTTSLRLCCHLLYLIKLWVGPYNFTQVVLPPTVPHQALGWSLQLHSGCVATYCTSSSSGLVLTTSLRLCCHLLYLIKLWAGPYNFTLPPTVPHQALGWSLQLHSGCVATYCTSSSSGLVLTTSLRLCCHLLYLIKLWVGPYNFTQVVLPPTVPHQALGWSLQLHSGCVATYCTSSSSGLVLTTSLRLCCHLLYLIKLFPYLVPPCLLCKKIFSYIQDLFRIYCIVASTNFLKPFSKNDVKLSEKL